MGSEKSGGVGTSRGVIRNRNECSKINKDDGTDEEWSHVINSWIERSPMVRLKVAN